MSDIVERLRSRTSPLTRVRELSPTAALCREAAAEIERLRNVVQSMKEPMKCECGFTVEVCATNLCMRKKVHSAGLTPGSKWPEPAPIRNRIKDTATSHEAKPFMMLSCREAGRCLHNLPGCICEVDPCYDVDLRLSAESETAKGRVRHIVRNLASVNMTDEVAERQARRITDALEAAGLIAGEPQTSREPGFVKPDNDRQVFFYEQDFYVLSNFSAFAIVHRGLRFDTSEHAYHWEKFTDGHDEKAALQIRIAPSAHEAFKIAERFKSTRRRDWDAVKVPIMRDILRAKVEQHEYVRRKLLATGDRELIEDSWRDDFWGWGPNRTGQNMLGKLWMEVREELRSSTVTRPHQRGGE